MENHNQLRLAEYFALWEPSHDEAAGPPVNRMEKWRENALRAWRRPPQGRTGHGNAAPWEACHGERTLMGPDEAPPPSPEGCRRNECTTSAVAGRTLWHQAGAVGPRAAPIVLLCGTPGPGAGSAVFHRRQTSAQDRPLRRRTPGTDSGGH